MQYPLPPARAGCPQRVSGSIPPWFRGRWYGREECLNTVLEGRNSVLEPVLNYEPSGTLRRIPVGDGGAHGIQCIDRFADADDGQSENLIGSVLATGRAEIGSADDSVPAGARWACDFELHRLRRCGR